MKKFTKNLIFLSFILGIIIHSGCEKQNSEPPVIIDPEYVKNDSINQNVSIIQSKEALLTSDSLEMAQGIYKFTYTSTPPTYKTGDIIVGQENEGFLRKVISSEINGSDVIMQTEQATLTDLFRYSSISFEDPSKSTNKSARLPKDEILYLAPNVKSLDGEGINLSLSDFKLQLGNNFSAELKTASIQIVPNIKYEHEIGLLGIDHISFFSKDTPITFEYNYAVQGKVTAQDAEEYVLFSKNSYHIVGLVVFAVNHKVKIKFEPSLYASLNYNYSSITKYVYDIGAMYEDGKFSGTFLKKSETSALLSNSLEVVAGGEMKLSVVYEPTVYIYGAIGPYANASVYGLMEGNKATNKDWDIALGRGFDATVGIKFKIFTLKGFDYSKTWDVLTPNVLVMPKELQYMAGDHQIGNFSEVLPKPILVKVVDNRDRKVSNVNVYFTPFSNSGKVANAIVKTDSEGYAETTWTLGQSGAQELKVQVRKADGTEIEGSPITITANQPVLNYQLQIGNYESDYVSNQVLQTLSPGDAVSLPNYMIQMVRLTLNGVPVVTGPYGLQWGQYTFGQVPKSSSDTTINNYQVSLRDNTNKRNVVIPLKLTLTNGAYRRIVNRTISCDYQLQFYSGGAWTLHFDDKGQYTKTYPDGSSAGTGTYSFIPEFASSNQDCQTYKITEPKIGCISTGYRGIQIPSYIYIYEDNSLTANSFYACQDADQRWLFK